MFKKRKAKEAAEIAALVDLRRKSLQQIEDQFAAIDGITDPADKIMKLEQLTGAIETARTCVAGKQRDIVNASLDKKGNIVTGTMGVAVIAGCVSGGILVAPAIFCGLVLLGIVPAASGVIAEGPMRKKKNKQLLAADPALADFAKIMKAQGTRAAALLEETQKQCDLNELSASPLLSGKTEFAKFINSHELLRDRFDAAARKAADKNDTAERPDPAPDARRNPPSP